MSLAKKSKKIEEAVLTEEKAKENTEEGSKEKVDLEAQSETEDAIVNEENDDSSMDVNEEVDD